MPPRNDNGDEDNLDEAFKVFKNKMSLEERVTTTHQQVLYLRRDLSRLEKSVQFKDTCEAKHQGENQRLTRLENDVKEFKEGNRFGITTILAIVAIIAAFVIPIAVVFIH